MPPRRTRAAGRDAEDGSAARKRAKANEIVEGSNTFAPSSAAEWREWLESTTAEGVWLVIYNKKSGVATCGHDEALDQALCFGWIDSVPRKRDAESHYQYFARRKPKSAWSRINKERVARLEKLGLMAEPGAAAVHLAKETGTWTALDDVENLVVPDDLAKAFTPASRRNWDALPRSTKRGLLERLYAAKRPETRLKRIDDIVHYDPSRRL